MMSQGSSGAVPTVFGMAPLHGNLPRVPRHSLLVTCCSHWYSQLTCPASPVAGTVCRSLLLTDADAAAWVFCAL
jgi:hypothetical protein